MEPLEPFEKILGRDRTVEICEIITKMEATNRFRLVTSLNPEYLAMSRVIEEMEKSSRIDIMKLTDYEVSVITNGGFSVEPDHYNVIEDAANMLYLAGEEIEKGASIDEAINKVLGESMEDTEELEQGAD
jgi:hypothetical protein